MQLGSIAELHREQLEAGRFFLHKHPSMASSWTEEPMSNLLAPPVLVCNTLTNANMEQRSRSLQVWPRMLRIVVWGASPTS